MSKHIILCADDFAQNEAISEGILSLAKLRRINAISCLVNSVHWNEMHPELAGVKQTNFIGLHLNLTFGQPLSAMWRKHEGEGFTGLPRLLKKTYFNTLDLQVVTAEIQAQVDIFTHTMHVYPDFIDGHEHVQQLPIVRRALLNVHTKQMGHTHHKSDENHDEDHDHPASFFRNTSNGWRDFTSLTSFPKCQLLAMLGGRRFKRSLVREQIPTNTSFSGIYNFKNAPDYRKYFQRFLQKTHDGGLIMCHPGQQSRDTLDPLHAYRHHELDYFMADVFLSDLEDNSYLLMNKS
ncbi:MAG: ChbG/HpnK family deacetylase [Legionellaceae bacterium]|nr:ChbG/HpnK family deacetylase [Legionellaceae bacterium]